MASHIDTNEDTEIVSLEESTSEIARRHMQDDDSPLFIVDLSVVFKQLLLWEEHLPRVRPLYAMKANDDDRVCRLLIDHGVGMEVASKYEMQKCVEWGMPRENILFGAPVKENSHIKYAQIQGITRCVADSLSELQKISLLYPQASVFMRIAVNDSEARCRFSSKFGLFESEWSPFIERSCELGINLCGVSFHVGSGGSGPLAFFDAIEMAKKAFELARDYGYHFKHLDIGGGFAGSDSETFEFPVVASAINVALSEFFSERDCVNVYAEPGRFFVAKSHTYAVSVIGKRAVLQEHLVDSDAIERPSLERSSEHDNVEKAEVALWINDGLYGCFNCAVFDHATIIPDSFIMKNSEGKVESTKIFGPTCDSIDVVVQCTKMPPLEVGDKILFADMGAYTRSAASRFNGYGYYRVLYVNRE